MGEVELLKNIKPLKWIINPFFFVPFEIGSNGFCVRKRGILVGSCSLGAMLIYKVFFISWFPPEDFQENLEVYLSLLTVVLCAFSFIGYASNARAIVNALNEIIPETVLIEDKNLYRGVRRVVLTQVCFCYTIPLIYTCATNYVSYINRKKYEYTIMDLVDYIGSNCFFYFVILHYAVTNIVFGNGLIFCHRIIRKLNLQLQDWSGQDQSANVPSRLFTKAGASITELNDSLLSVIRVYDLVCEWCVSFCQFFGIPLIGSFISALSTVILYTYYLTKYGLTDLWMFLFAFFYCIFRIWFVLYACEKLTKEMRKTGLIVNRLLIDGKCQKQKDLLQDFSNLLLHRKVKFTANGTVALDYKLIYSAVATVVAYLAITYQFDYASTSRQCSKNETVIN